MSEFVTAVLVAVAAAILEKLALSIARAIWGATQPAQCLRPLGFRLEMKPPRVLRARYLS